MRQPAAGWSVLFAQRTRGRLKGTLVLLCKSTHESLICTLESFSLVSRPPAQPHPRSCYPVSRGNQQQNRSGGSYRLPRWTTLWTCMSRACLGAPRYISQGFSGRSVSTSISGPQEIRTSTLLEQMVHIAARLWRDVTGKVPINVSFGNPGGDFFIRYFPPLMSFFSVTSEPCVHFESSSHGTKELLNLLLMAVPDVI